MDTQKTIIGITKAESVYKQIWSLQLSDTLHDSPFNPMAITSVVWKFQTKYTNDPLMPCYIVLSPVLLYLKYTTALPSHY